MPPPHLNENVPSGERSSVADGPATSPGWSERLREYKWIVALALLLTPALAMVTRMGDGPHLLATDKPWTVEGAFRKSGNYRGTTDGLPPELTARRDFAYWGSHSGSDGLTGRLTSAAFPALARAAIYVAGHPNMHAGHLTIELSNPKRGAKVPVSLDADPGVTWRLVRLPVPPDWIGEEVQLLVSDEAEGSGGWIGVSTPFYYGGNGLLLFALFCGLGLALVLVPGAEGGFGRHRWAALACCALVSAVVLRTAGSRFTPLLEASYFIGAALAFLIVPPAVLLRRWFPQHFDADSAFLVAPPAAIFYLSICFLPLCSLRAPSPAYLLVVLAPAVLAIVLARKPGSLGTLGQIGADARHAIWTTVLVTVAALAFVTAGGNRPADLLTAVTVANREFHSLPSDNALPYDTAMAFASYAAPWQWGPGDNWTMGDRPPLLGVVNAVIAHAMGIPNQYPFWFFQVVATLANALFFIPLAFLSARLFPSRRLWPLTLLAVAINEFVFLNIYYTWPKLFGTYFLLVALALGFRMPHTRVFFAIAGIVVGLGSQAHAGVALSLPVIGMAYVALTARVHRLRLVLFALIFSLGFAAAQTPWKLYKSRHPEIDTEKLLAEHFYPVDYPKLGLTPPRHYTSKIREELRLFWEQVPAAQQWRIRVENIQALANHDSLLAKSDLVLAGNFGGLNSPLHPSIFFRPVSLLGESSLALGGAVLASWLFRRARSGAVERGANLPLIVTALGAVLASYVLNAFLKFTPPCNHEAPYAEMLLALVLVNGMCFLAGRLATALVLIAALLRFWYVVDATSRTHGIAAGDLGIAVTALLMAGVALLAVRHGRRNAQSPPSLLAEASSRFPTSD